MQLYIERIGINMDSYCPRILMGHVAVGTFHSGLQLTSTLPPFRFLTFL